MVYTFCVVEYEAMKLLRRNNDRREERLKRVRTKNFRKKEEEVEVRLLQYTTVYHCTLQYITVYLSLGGVCRELCAGKTGGCKAA